MKIKIFPIVLVLSILLLACLPTMTVAEPEITASPDAEIRIYGWRGIGVDITDLREDQSTDMNTKIVYEFDYIFRETYSHVDTNSIHHGSFTFLRPPHLLSFGKCTVDVTAGNTHASAIGIVMGRWVKLLTTS